MKEFYIRDAAQQENKVVTTSFVVSNKQIKSIIKWNPCFDIATGLKETKKFYSKRLKHYLR